MTVRILLFFLCSFSGRAADFVNTNFHAWGAYFGDHPVGSSRWGVHLEAQVRRHDGFASWQQLLLRPGINYAVNKHLTATVGYAFIFSHRYGENPAIARRLPEHRAWYQANVKYKTGKIAWSNRLRFENRWIGTADDKFRFENRFRVWQRAVVPLSRTYYVAAYDEVWFYVKPYVSKLVLDQNRAYAALGRRFGPNAELEIGYLNQSIWQRTGLVRENNHTLMFSLFSRKPFGKTTR